MRRFLLALWLAALGCGLPAVARADDAAGGSPDRQILVMLRQAPPHSRPNADYGGAYGDDMARSALVRQGRRIARHHGLTLVSDWPMPLLGIDCLVMAVPDGQSLEAVAAQVSRESGVAWSQPMHVYQALGDAARYDDPLFAAEPAARSWHLADLHRLATGRGVTVAIVDTGIETRHPDLAGQIAASLDFTAGHPSSPEQHGTGVAGIVAARADNGVGIVGIAPHARLMALRACWQQAGAARSVCDSVSLAKALEYAIAHRAQVINLSLGGPQDLLIGRLLDIGLARGAAVVAAFDSGRADGGFPASHAGVIAVADESLAAPPPGVYIAPGRGIPTTQPGGRWYLVNGSSYAAAHVSGLIALLRERPAAGSGAIAFVSARSGGGAIDAWATLRAARGCDFACVRELAANARP